MKTVAPPVQLRFADVEWAVGVLARRRAELVPYAPVYWRPAADAEARHAAYLDHLLGEGGGVGFRTETSLMLASPGHSGWTVDDAYVPPARWDRDGVDLWTRTMAEVGAEPMRFVCPVFESERSAFALGQGLRLVSSWWHAEALTPGATSSLDTEIQLKGASASLVPAPPVYDPGGPITFPRDVEDVTAIVRAHDEAARRGSPVVVVDQPAGAGRLGQALSDAGFTRHCDLFANR